VSWGSEGEYVLRAGFDRIPGIGEKQSAVIVAHRDDPSMSGFDVWQDLIDVKGIGPKTLENILKWVNQDDPLGVHVLDRKLKKVVDEIKSGKLRGEFGRKLPRPTHTVEQVPQGKGKDTLVTWIGILVHRNLRDLFEVNLSRTGVPLNPDKVKRPDLREWVLLHGTDGDDILTITIDRWNYAKFKEAVWNIKLGHDIVLIKGLKKGFLPHKQVYVKEMWVIE
jgi:hypothetical protein